jgi:DNA-binding NtrC family response regulator
VLSSQRPPGTDSELLLHAVLHLGQQIREMRRILEERLPEPVVHEPAAFRAPSTSMADAERRAIETALLETGGNRREAARRLGIGERTLYRKIKDYGLR